MGIRAGDIRGLRWFGRELDVKGEDANVEVDLGGFTNEMGINGNGTGHDTQRRKKSRIGGVPVSIDDSRGDLEFLQEKANLGAYGPLQIVMPSGKTLGTSMKLTGDLFKSTGDGVATCTWEAPTKLEEI